MGLSIRAYARHRGVSHVAVLRAIKQGRVALESDGTIEPQKADASWERATDPAQRSGYVQRLSRQPARNLFGAMPASRMKAALTAANFVPIPLDDSIRGMVPGRHVRQPGDAIGSIPQKRSAPPRVAEPGMDGAGG
jgi:hypothetical protein